MYVPIVSVTVMVGVGDGVPLVGSGEAMLEGVWPSDPLLVVSDVATSEGVGLPVDSTVLVLLVVLSPVKCVKYIIQYTYVCVWRPFCKGL